MNISRAPDESQLRRALTAISVGCVTAFANVYVTQAILPELSLAFGVAPTEAGLTISVVTMMLAFASLVTGPLSDRIGVRPVMVWGSGLLVVPTLMCAIAPSFALLVAARALQGAFIPAVTSVALAAIPGIFPSARVGAALGVVIASNVFGGLLSRLGAGVITDLFGWRSAFAASGAAALLGAFALARGLPQATRRVGPPRRLEFGSSLRDPRLLGADLVGGLMFFAFIGMFTYLSYRLSGPPFHLPPSLVGSAYVSYLAGVWVSPRAGRLSDRLGRRPVIGVGLGVLAFGMLLTLSGSLPVLVSGLLLACLGIFSVQPAATALVGDLAPRGSKGSAAALYQFFYYIFGSLGGVLVGLGWQHFAWGGVVIECLIAVGLAALSNIFLCREAVAKLEPSPETG